MIDREQEYEKATGKKPVERFPKDHPDRWQWDYAGKRGESEGLLERLADEPTEAQPEQEETLF